MGRFVSRLGYFVERHFSEKTIAVAHKDFEMVNYIHEYGYVLFVHYEPDRVYLRVRMENRKMNKLLNDSRIEEVIFDFEEAD